MLTSSAFTISGKVSFWFSNSPPYQIRYPGGTGIESTAGLTRVNTWLGSPPPSLQARTVRVRTPLRRTIRPGSQTGDTVAMLFSGTRAPVTGEITYVLETSCRFWRNAGASLNETFTSRSPSQYVVTGAPS